MKTLDSELLVKLYAAVGKPEAFNTVMGELCRMFDATTGMWVALGQGLQQQQTHSFYAAHNHAESVSRAYSDHWWQRDIWTLAAMRRNALRTGVVGIGSEYVSLDELRASAFYKEFLTTMPAEHLLAVMVADGMDDPAAPAGFAAAPPTYISLFRPPGATPFVLDDKAALAALHPHLRRAFDLHCQWRVMQEQLDVFSTSIGSLDFGVVFIDAASCVRYANSTAHTLASSLWPAFKPIDGVCTFTQILQNADVHSVTRLVNAAALGVGGFVQLSSVSPAQPLQAVVVAMPVSNPGVKGRAGGAGKTRSSVLLTLVDKASRPFSAANFLSRAFSLSKSETRLLPLLLRGSAPSDIAQVLKLKLPTVRSQLAAIFVKTGTARQQELIALMGIVPPVHEIAPRARVAS